MSNKNSDTPLSKCH